MSGADTIALGVTAVTCVGSATHNPRPLRFVWHHLQPKQAGGLTVPANLVPVCDSCHYSVHRLMWLLANQPGNPTLASPPRRAQLAMATIGYQACVTAGTVALIPNEGGS